MSQRVVTFGVWVVTLVCAAGAGAFFARDDSRPVVATPGDEHETSATGEPSSGLTASDVRAIIRSENERARATQASATANSVPTEAGEERAQVRVVATEEARAIVAQATFRRTWTMADRDALRRHIDALSREDRDALLTSLVAAINRGEIRVTERMSLL